MRQVFFGKKTSEVTGRNEKCHFGSERDKETTDKRHEN